MLFLLVVAAIPLSLKDGSCYGEDIPVGSTARETALDQVMLDYVEEYNARSIRDTPTPGMPIPLSDKDKMEIVNAHNRYRSNVTPPAANMRYMKWDDEIASYAQIWANKCVFKHGRHLVSEFKWRVGQSIYQGKNSTLSNYISLWYEEVHDFDMKLKQCNGTKCGHYIQLVWGESYLIGCGLTQCEGKRESFYIFVCHYYKPYDSPNPYKVGRPCSLCDVKTGLCYNNMCVSKEDCEKEKWPCECNLKCHNCGVLNKSTCTCKCSPGWDFQDCSQQCIDEDSWCGKEDGYKGWVGCAMIEDGIVKDSYCRKMCESCEDITEDNKQMTCCEGKRCDPGYVLSLSDGSCSCRLLCPGPECYRPTESDVGHILRGINSFLIAVVIATHILWYD